jgi:hypothetical protein
VSIPPASESICHATVPQNRRHVLGADLNCSESSRMRWSCVDTRPPSTSAPRLKRLAATYSPHKRKSPAGGAGLFNIRRPGGSGGIVGRLPVGRGCRRYGSNVFLISSRKQCAKKCAKTPCAKTAVAAKCLKRLVAGTRVPVGGGPLAGFTPSRRENWVLAGFKPPVSALFRCLFIQICITFRYGGSGDGETSPQC